MQKLAQHELVTRILHSYDRDISDLDRIWMLPNLTPEQLEALRQLVSPVWDGNLISKQARSDLVDMGLVSRWSGLNFATQAGYCVLRTLRMLGDETKFSGGLPK